MGIKVTKSAICDHCEVEIDISLDYVDASTYGVTLHMSCFSRISAARLLRILNLDEIYVKRGEQRICRAMEAYDNGTS